MNDKLKDLKELLDLVLDGVSVAVDAEKDGKLDISDAALLLKLIPDVGPAFADIGNVPAELAAMSAEDAAEIVTYVMGKLAIADDKARKVIDAALKLAAAGYGMYAALKA